MRLARGTAFTDPLYHLSAYGLQNPVVAECIERGFYDPSCARCGGDGKISKWVWSGAKSWHQESTPCTACSGSGLRPDRPVHEADFGDAESLAWARKMFPGMRVDRHEFPCRASVANPGVRCTCVLLS